MHVQLTTAIFIHLAPGSHTRTKQRHCSDACQPFLLVAPFEEFRFESEKERHALSAQTSYIHTHTDIDLFSSFVQPNE